MSHKNGSLYLTIILVNLNHFLSFLIVLIVDGLQNFQQNTHTTLLPTMGEQCIHVTTNPSCARLWILSYLNMENKYIFAESVRLESYWMRPAKPVHVALYGSVQVTLEPIHHKQHSGKSSSTLAAVPVVYHWAMNCSNPPVLGNISAWNKWQSPSIHHSHDTVKYKSVIYKSNTHGISALGFAGTIAKALRRICNAQITGFEFRPNTAA